MGIRKISLLEMRVITWEKAVDQEFVRRPQRAIAEDMVYLSSLRKFEKFSAILTQRAQKLVLSCANIDIPSISFSR